MITQAKTYSEIVQEIRTVVTEYRSRLERVWPTPSPKPCLMFAATESAEAIDAYLRLSPEYARNNEKNLAITEEVADCLMMLVSSGIEYTPYLMDDTFKDRVLTEGQITRLNWEVACAVMNYPNGEVDAALRTAISILGPDAAQAVEKRLKRIEAKHALNVKGQVDFECKMLPMVLRREGSI